MIHDPSLVEIPAALDVHAVQELLEKRIPEFRNEFEISDLKIVDVQYKPGLSCKILYRLKARNRETKRTANQMFSGIITKDPASTTIAQDLSDSYRARKDAIFSEPVFPLPELRMVAFPFPVDPELPWLTEALDADNLKREIHRHWMWRDVHVRKIDVRPIGYTPQARAAIFCEVLTQTNDTKEPELRRLIGKIHAYKPAAVLFSGAWALWRALDHKIRIAPPVGYISSLRLTLQEQIRGERLTEFAHMGSFVKPVKKVARSIALVHKLSLPLASTRTPEKEAAVIHRWKSILAVICPEQKQRIENLASKVAQDLISYVAVKGPVHGDFHPANVIWDENSVTLVDLDDLSYGDPLVDVGRFMASLRVSSLRVSSKISALDNTLEAFLQKYLHLTQDDEKRARLFEAGSLIIAACAPFRLQREGWQEAALLLLDEAERVYSNSKGVAVSTKTEPVVVERTKWISDGVYMRTVLDPHVRKIYGVDLASCRMSNPEDPEKLEYELHGWRGNEKWDVILRGTIWDQRGGNAVIKRLNLLRSITSDLPNAPLLPKPVAYIREFSLIVWEPPTGIPFLKLIRKNNELPKRAAMIARALSVLHRTDLDIRNQYSQESEIELLRKDIRALEKMDSGSSDRVKELFLETTRRMSSNGWALAPVLRKLRPKDILFCNDQVAFANLEKLTKSHPYIDAGDFLARLNLAGIRKNRIKETKQAADTFREEYQAGKGDLAAFEVAALLRLASRCVGTDSEAALINVLLDLAADKLEGQP